MKTRILMLLSAFLMAACADQRGADAPAGTADNPVVTTFSTSEPDTLDVQVTDREPVTRVELAAPDGQVFTAHQIDRERLSRRGGSYGQPSMGVGVGGGSGGFGVGTGVGFGFPLGGGDYGAPRDPRVASTAKIRVPDMAAYRARWQQWKVRVTLGEGGSKRVIEVGAPPPPPATG